MEKANRRFLIFIIVFSIILAATGIVFLPFMRELENPEYRERISAFVRDLGFKGVLLFFFIQVAQNLIALIPGGPVQVIAGAAFGTWGGLFILQAGVIVSASIIFILVRKFNNTVVLRFFGADALETWSFLKNEKATAQLIFVLFIITGVPKDALTYIVAMTKFPFALFLPISLVARFPGMILSTLMGSAAMQGNWLMTILIFSITGTAGILGIHFRDRIIKKFAKLEQNDKIS